MAGTKLATAYVQIIPTTTGLNTALKKEIEPAVSDTGTRSGESFSKNFVSILKKGAFGLTIGSIIKEGVSTGIEEASALQQSRGGVETLFKVDADKVKAFANEAYKTAGMSANEYMEQVTSFSASLLQSLEGDTAKAAEVANMALIDMSDNSNKFGAEIGRITDAYQGFAKQNFTMLDNLKLGYGGTEAEMKRLLADAEALTGLEYNISSLNDIFNAIHAIQEELEITGTTAKEASETFSGSLASMKASVKNLFAKLTLGEDVGDELQQVGETLETFLVDSFAPFLVNLTSSVLENAPSIIVNLAEELIKHIPDIVTAGLKLGKALIDGVLKGIMELFDTLLEPFRMLGDKIKEGAAADPYAELNASSGLYLPGESTRTPYASITNNNFTVDAASLKDVQTMEETMRDAQRMERMGRG